KPMLVFLNNTFFELPLLYHVEFRALAAAGLAFAMVVRMGSRTIGWLKRMKIGDAGETDAEALRAHSASKAHTPTMGGILIAGAILASVVLLCDLTQMYVQLGIIVLIWMGAVGGADDYLKLTASRRGAGSRQGLYAWEKLVFQLGIGLLVGIFAYRYGSGDEGHRLAHVVNLPFQRTFEPGGALNPSLIFLTMPVYILVTMLMIAGMSNAVNITDGMDGLAAGTSASVAMGILILAIIAGTQDQAQRLLVPYIPFGDEIAVLAGAMLGGCLGFLWWNCSPAQVFMGDTGSLCLGGLIGYMAIVVRQEVVVLAMCGVFLFEIGSVIAQVGYFRLSGGSRLFRCAPV
ncbi:MAG: phospho-N-acetylmuramoyl-pentapeptide-transferase, partial [Phycisphaerales bacterium]